ncbi:hypothetical protein KL949_003815 [Ogataea haglerorum]|nr:hypothetical protein KL913_003724 [Ogataea haglerorum]KAG7716524.1 hypothetical protein KL949_003815 [Ogataea haglerorum]KAG7755394.1 hypothetical protein KL947_004240 [Ogataea haglerorum]
MPSQDKPRRAAANPELNPFLSKALARIYGDDASVEVRSPEPSVDEDIEYWKTLAQRANIPLEDPVREQEPPVTHREQQQHSGKPLRSVFRKESAPVEAPLKPIPRRRNDEFSWYRESKKRYARYLAASAREERELYEQIHREYIAERERLRRLEEDESRVAKLAQLLREVSENKEVQGPEKEGRVEQKRDEEKAEEKEEEKEDEKDEESEETGEDGEPEPDKQQQESAQSDSSIEVIELDSESEDSEQAEPEDYEEQPKVADRFAGKRLPPISNYVVSHYGESDGESEEESEENAEYSEENEEESEMGESQAEESEEPSAESEQESEQESADNETGGETGAEVSESSSKPEMHQPVEFQEIDQIMSEADSILNQTVANESLYYSYREDEQQGEVPDWTQIALLAQQETSVYDDVVDETTRIEVRAEETAETEEKEQPEEEGLAEAAEGAEEVQEAGVSGQASAEESEIKPEVFETAIMDTTESEPSVPAKKHKTPPPVELPKRVPSPKSPKLNPGLLDLLSGAFEVHNKASEESEPVVSENTEKSVHFVEPGPDVSEEPEPEPDSNAINAESTNIEHEETAVEDETTVLVTAPEPEAETSQEYDAESTFLDTAYETAMDSATENLEGSDDPAIEVVAESSVIENDAGDASIDSMVDQEAYATALLNTTQADDDTESLLANQTVYYDDENADSEEVMETESAESLASDEVEQAITEEYGEEIAGKRKQEEAESEQEPKRAKVQTGLLDTLEQFASEAMMDISTPEVDVRETEETKEDGVPEEKEENEVPEETEETTVICVCPESEEQEEREEEKEEEMKELKQEQEEKQLEEETENGQTYEETQQQSANEEPQTDSSGSGPQSDAGSAEPTGFFSSLREFVSGTMMEMESDGDRRDVSEVSEKGQVEDREAVEQSEGHEQDEDHYDPENVSDKDLREEVGSEEVPEEDLKAQEQENEAHQQEKTQELDLPAEMQAEDAGEVAEHEEEEARDEEPAEPEEHTEVIHVPAEDSHEEQSEELAAETAEESSAQTEAESEGTEEPFAETPEEGPTQVPGTPEEALEQSNEQPAREQEKAAPIFSSSSSPTPADDDTNCPESRVPEPRPESRGFLGLLSDFASGTLADISPNVSQNELSEPDAEPEEAEETAEAAEETLADARVEVKQEQEQDEKTAIADQPVLKDELEEPVQTITVKPDPASLESSPRSSPEVSPTASPKLSETEAPQRADTAEPEDIPVIHVPATESPAEPQITVKPESVGLSLGDVPPLTAETHSGSERSRDSSPARRTRGRSQKRHSSEPRDSESAKKQRRVVSDSETSRRPKSRPSSNGDRLYRAKSPIKIVSSGMSTRSGRVLSYELEQKRRELSTPPPATLPKAVKDLVEEAEFFIEEEKAKELKELVDEAQRFVEEPVREIKVEKTRKPKSTPEPEPEPEHLPRRTSRQAGRVAAQAEPPARIPPPRRTRRAPKDKKPKPKSKK